MMCSPHPLTSMLTRLDTGRRPSALKSPSNREMTIMRLHWSVNRLVLFLGQVRVINPLVAQVVHLGQVMVCLKHPRYLLHV